MQQGATLHSKGRGEESVVSGKRGQAKERRATVVFSDIILLSEEDCKFARKHPFHQISTCET